MSDQSVLGRNGQLLNAYSVATTAAADIPKWDFGFVKVNMIGYQAQVLPAILAAFVLVYLEKFFRKITPQVVSMIVVPFCSLVLSVMIAHFVVGPIGWKIGSAISAIAAIVCVATSTTANAIGVGGIPGILSIQPKYMGSFAICMLIAIVIPIVLTLIVGKKKLSEEEKNGKTIAETEEITEKSEAEEKEVTHLTAFLTGNVIPVKEVNDGVFSEGVMGDGFEYLIEQGQFVKEGTPLIKFDREKIKKAGYRDVTICVISETGNAKNITFETGTTATANKTQVASWEN